MKITHHQTNLKRNRLSLQSTALQTLQSTRTVSKFNVRPDTRPPDINDTIKSIIPMIKQSKQKQQSTNTPQFTFKQIEYNILEQRAKRDRRNNSKFMRHFYYKGINRTIQHILLSIPPFVTQIYQKQQIKRLKPSSQPVSFSQGFLQNINCVYYAIENKLIFIKIQDILDCTDPSAKDIPYFVHQVRNQVVNIVQIVGQNLLFPTYQLILAVIHPWEMQFYAWQTSKTIKNSQQLPNQQYVKQSGLKPLNFIYKLPVQTVKHMDYSTDSRLLFFDNKGALHQITPHEQTRLMILKTGRYNIRNYVNSSHNTFQLLSKKHGKFSPVYNMVLKANQLTKYFFPYRIDTLGIFYDHRRQVLFGLLKKNTKLIIGSQNKIFIVCYSVKANQKAVLLHKFSQEYFIENYSNYFQRQISYNFGFHSIHPAPAHYNNANILITTKSGVKIIMDVFHNNLSIVQVIRPVDYQMFQYNIKRDNISQYAPLGTNSYKLQSFYQDQDKSICTLSRDKGYILTYVSSSTAFQGYTDINQKTNQIDMQIYRQGSWKVKINKIDQTKMATYLTNNISDMNNRIYMDQLTNQTLCGAQLYLFQGQSKLQLMSYVRPIDILFTCILLVQRIKHKQTKSNHPHPKISTQQILLKIFINQNKNWSYITNREITYKQLCAMLLQLLVDKSGIYYYCVDAAKQVLTLCEQINNSNQNLNHKQNQNQNYKYNKQYKLSDYFTQIQYNNNKNIKKDHITNNKKNKIINISYLYPYNRIQNKIKQQIRLLMTSISQRGVRQQKVYQNKKIIQRNIINEDTFYDFPQVDTNRLPKDNIITYKISVINKYISYLLQIVWNEDITSINHNLRNILIQKLQYLQQYIKIQQNYMKVYNEYNHHINQAHQQLQYIVIRTKQLLLLLNNVNVSDSEKGIVFCSLLRLGAGDELLQAIMFANIHRQYRYYIIHKWYNLFPTFVSGQFVKLVSIYGQLQQLKDKQTILVQLKRNKITTFPIYFYNYLTKIRKITDQQLSQYLNVSLKDIEKKKKQQNKYNYSYPNDFQFAIPQRIKELTDKYRRQSTNLSEIDVQQIISYCLNKEENKQKQLTIANKQSLMTYVLKNFPTHPKFQFMSKCISVQYELYRYYLKKTSQYKKENELKVKSISLKKLFNIKEKKKTDDDIQNPQTIQLLRFHVLTQKDKIKKLVWASADLWVMADFCATFDDLDELKNILREICQQFQSAKNRRFSSFSSYIQTFLLNIAIKSKYSEFVLALICQIVDQYLQSLNPVKKLLKQWVKFQSISVITNKIFCVAQILIKVGYNPQAVLKIYLQQMQNIFDKNIPIENQLIYGLKVLNSFILVEMYVRNKGRQLTRIINLEMNALQRVGNIKQSVREGIKKLLDNLVQKSQ